MPNKVNAAVSQLAGEIAARCPKCGAIEEHLDIWGSTFAQCKKCNYGCSATWKNLAQFFSAALSEREEKVAKLIEAARVLVNQVEPKYPGSLEWNLAAALSALGESK